MFTGSARLSLLALAVGVCTWSAHAQSETQEELWAAQRQLLIHCGQEAWRMLPPLPDHSPATHGPAVPIEWTMHQLDLAASDPDRVMEMSRRVPDFDRLFWTMAALAGGITRDPSHWREVVARVTEDRIGGMPRDAVVRDALVDAAAMLTRGAREQALRLADEQDDPAIASLLRAQIALLDLEDDTAPALSVAQGIADAELRDKVLVRIAGALEPGSPDDGTALAAQCSSSWARCGVWSQVALRLGRTDPASAKAASGHALEEWLGVTDDESLWSPVRRLLAEAVARFQPDRAEGLLASFPAAALRSSSESAEALALLCHAAPGSGKERVAAILGGFTSPADKLSRESLLGIAAGLADRDARLDLAGTRPFDPGRVLALAAFVGPMAAVDVAKEAGWLLDPFAVPAAVERLAPVDLDGALAIAEQLPAGPQTTRRAARSLALAAAARNEPERVYALVEEELRSGGDLAETNLGPVFYELGRARTRAGAELIPQQGPTPLSEVSLPVDLTGLGLEGRGRAMALGYLALAMAALHPEEARAAMREAVETAEGATNTEAATVEMTPLVAGVDPMWAVQLIERLPEAPEPGQASRLMGLNTVALALEDRLGWHLGSLQP
jgi:hypothetical protein